MKFAIVNGARHEPEKGLVGNCPNCGNLMIAKCGLKIIHHWSHKGKLECDLWWENETEWHRNWKGHFPANWQEVVHKDESTGERHVADVKTDEEWVIEFQHSFLKLEERNSRNNFYKKLVWVVDGKRLKTDETVIKSAIEGGVQLGFTRKIHPDSCSLLKDWNSNHAVFFDVGQDDLIVLLPKCHDEILYVFPFSKSEFIEVFLNEGTERAINFKNLLLNFPKMVFLNQLQVHQRNQQMAIIQQRLNAQRTRHGAKRRFRL